MFRLFNQCGRSMVEMLGVLAIIGVLSIGGLEGYSRAMNKFKLNQTIEEYNTVFNLIITDMEQWKTLPSEETTSSTYYQLSKFWKKLDVLPKKMIRDDTNYLYDSLGNKMYIRKISSGIEFGLFMNSQGDDSWSTSRTANNVCHALYDEIRSRSDEIGHVFLYLTDGDTSSWKYDFYGRSYCTGSKQCIQNMTRNDIEKICNECEKDKMCRLAIIWYF